MILMNDFGREPAALRDKMRAALERVLGSGWFILGRECESFERAWANTCGTTRAIGVANGMDAIEIALRALRIGAGDEVITTPMTAFATVLAVHRAGATPVLADIDPETALLDPESVRRCLTPRTRAVLPVHLYGQIRDMDRWSELCAQAGVDLVEDCAQAHLATLGGKRAGSFGVAGAYSFYPTKNLGALGDAGAIVTNDETLAALIERLRNYGQSQRYHHPELGLNSRLDEIQAAILEVRLSWLEGFTERRREIASRYRTEIDNPRVRLLAPPSERDAHVYHLFVIRCDPRAALQAHLEANGIQALVHYPIPIDQQPPFAGLARDPQGLGSSKSHADTCLSLPCHPFLTDADVARVIDAVNGFAG